MAVTMPRPRNVLVIQVDDLGWHQVGCQDGGLGIHETPNLDRLAAGGMRFTRGYAAAPISSASRAALLTGQSPTRLHLEFVTAPDGKPSPTHTRLLQPSFPQELRPGVPTLGDQLTDAGYSTGFVGKWHLTQRGDRYLSYGDTNGPGQRGYSWTEGDFGAHPYTYEDHEFGAYPDGEYPRDRSSEAAVAFIRENRDRPFYLHFASYFPHVPVHTPCRWLYEKYQAKGPGLDAEKIAFGAFVETMDAYIGRVLDALDTHGLSDDTLVVFTSDHGPDPRHAVDGPFRGNKWTLYESGIRVPFFIRWPGVVEPGSTCDVPVTGSDLMPTLSDLTGAACPDTQDGASIAPLLTRSGPLQRTLPLYWHFPFYHPAIGYEGTLPCSALMVEDRKLVYFHEDRRSELYRLDLDPAETRDLAREEPALTRDLERQLHTILQACNARLPRPNPAYLDWTGKQPTDRQLSGG